MSRESVPPPSSSPSSPTGGDPSTNNGPAQQPQAIPESAIHRSTNRDEDEDGNNGGTSGGVAVPNNPPSSVNSPSPLSASSAVSPPSQPISSLPSHSPYDSAPRKQPPGLLLLLIALVLMGIGLFINVNWLSLTSSLVALLLALRIFWVSIQPFIAEVISSEQVALTASIIGGVIAIIGLFQVTGVNQRIGEWFEDDTWSGVGALGDLVGAVGQILIAILAVYIAWRQYVISKDLTIQQNLITQQQTIDSYFQGISDLVLDAEGLLEDWPQERAIAEGRTAAILSSVDSIGKAKIVRFLSRSRLLTPLKRDRHLGRAMLDGMGGYQEDRDFGIRVIDLGVMLAASNLAGTDLRWTDLSDVNLVRANLASCDLVKSNLGRAILYAANLRGADLMGTRLFYGSLETASPRTRTEVPNYTTGSCTGAVVENADFTGVQRLSEQQRQYICMWGGEKTRSTVPGGCGNTLNKLGR
ncbi:MAG: pentapeptide repeat-containing protein [Merismopedia sp. SIO2A8]|nr:pentapeptide repeat-containing protein [Merismopedia sp. SIO2A8]